MTPDFTLEIYSKLLLALQQSGYQFFTFEDWCEGRAEGRYVILRHDVDLRAAYSLATARIEAEMDIRATYYFRVVPQSNQPEIIKAIAELGHEIGYHYEDLSLFDGNIDKALKHFGQKLEYFRQFYPVRTICMHGSPTSRWDNRELWKSNSYRDFGIIGEPYFDFLTVEGIFYMTDTARMWNGDKYNVRDKISHQSTTQPDIHSTFDFIEWIEQKPVQNIIMITTHPQRWTNNPIDWFQEYFIQNLKNIAKRWIISQQ
jgi:hypothetical protein